MKNGLFVGGLLLALLASVSNLPAQEGKWQAVDNLPRTQAADATLDRPVPLKTAAENTAFMPSASAQNIVPVRFEMPAATSDSHSDSHVVQSVAEKRSGSTGGPEIIAVSAPVQGSPAASLADDEEPMESLFAVDRPLRPSTARGLPRPRSVIQTGVAASPISAAPAPFGWQPPVNSSWTASPQKSWSASPPNILGADNVILEDGDGGFAQALNPVVRRRFYARGEYLLWWLQGQQVPVLASTSNASDSGILGAPSTSVLFGGNGINTGPFSGFRGTVGYWFGCNADKAVEFGGFFVGPLSSNYSVSSINTPVIGRPFQEANNGQEFAQLTALPNVTAGALTIHAPTTLWGLQGNLLCLLCCGCNYRISALAGFRNINLNEGLSIREDIQGLPTAPQPFTNQQITVLDSFSTQNHFYGGQVGLDARYYWGRLSFDTRATVALGDTVQQLDISGTQRFVSPNGNVQNFTGGLLALPGNIGHHMNNAFSVVPQIGFNVGYQILPSLRAFVGYNFLYWSNVIRPGTSIDRSLDVTKIPNFPLNPEPAPVSGAHPAPVFHEVGFWAQGLTFGLEFNY